MTERGRFEAGFLCGMLEGSGVQSAAVVDLSSNSHWSSQEKLVAGAQCGEPNFYWLLSGWRGGSTEARRQAGWLAFWAPRQGRLIGEEEAIAEVEAFGDSSGVILKEAGVVQV